MQRCSQLLLRQGGHTARRSFPSLASSSATNGSSSDALVARRAASSRLAALPCWPPGSTTGFLHPTRVNRFLPQLGRLVAAGGLVLGQAFLLAYAREKQKARMQEEQEQEGGADGDGGKEGKERRMTPYEAIQILGVEKANPALLQTFSPQQGGGDGNRVWYEYPVLTQARDREVARENFERMFALAVKHENQFLAGKLSLAFRICVDPHWDANVGGGNGGGKEDGKEGHEKGDAEEKKDSKRVRE